GSRGSPVHCCKVADSDIASTPVSPSMPSTLCIDGTRLPYARDRLRFGIRVDHIQSPRHLDDVSGRKIRVRFTEKLNHPGHIFSGTRAPPRGFLIPSPLYFGDPFLLVFSDNIPR